MFKRKTWVEEGPNGTITEKHATPIRTRDLFHPNGDFALRFAWSYGKLDLAGFEPATFSNGDFALHFACS